MEAPALSPPPYRPRPEIRPTVRERLRRFGLRVFHALLFLVTVVLALGALFGDKGLFEGLRARREYAEAAGALDRLRRENARLREEARRLRADPAAVEDVARRELGMIGRGEVVFIVKDAPPRPDFRPPRRPARR